GKCPAPRTRLRATVKGDRAQNIVFLFGALKAAPDEDPAKHVETRIWGLWMGWGSDTADLLMSRVKTAIDQKDADLGIKLLDSIIALKPDYIEAWNRRATLYFAKKEFGPPPARIRPVLAREPRHFGARTRRGLIVP